LEDEVIVVGDGPQPMAWELASTFDQRVKYIECEPTLMWGHAQRNYGMKWATSSHLAFMDDDDIYLPGAFKAIHETIQDNRSSPILFRMMHRGEVIWTDQKLRRGNVGTQMLVVPNVRSKLGTWMASPEIPGGSCGDLLFIQETVGLWPEGSLIWKEDIIAYLLKHSDGKP
jgi:glycosyltransferase involved in cell wall biosynthesis